MFRQLRPPTVRTYVESDDVDNARRGLFIAKVFFFCYYGSIGTLAPFLNVYLEQIGLNGVQIGWIGSIPPLIALVANPLWGTISDRWQIHRLVLATLTFMGGLVSLLFLTSISFWAILLFTVLMTFFRRPIGSILDGAAVAIVKQTGDTYGRQRLWGSLGFVTVSYGLGWILTGRDLTYAFWFHALLLAGVCTVVSLRLPIAGGKERVNILAGLKQLGKESTYRYFLASVALIGMGMAGYIGFLSLYMIDLGGGAQELGLLWVAVGIMEVPVMYFGARRLERYSYQTVLRFSMLGFMLGWLLMAFANSPLYLCLNVLIISSSYACYWVSVVNYASESAPKGLSATAQALIGAAQGGLGWSIGSVVAGYLWDASGGTALYLFSATAAFVAVVSFWWGNREYCNGKPDGGDMANG
ncbi:MAG: major facilitator superfamily domain-containing protein 6 [Chloroflexota bacterium]